MRASFDFSIELRSCLLAVLVVGWLIMLLGLRCYDLGRLAGKRQIRIFLRGERDAED